MIVSGTSAGGLSAHLHAPLFAARLPRARVVAAPDAAWWWDTPAYNNPASRPWLDSITPALPLWNISFNPANPAAAACLAANAGARAGKEVPQTYVSFPASAGEPPNQLRGFSAVLLDVGEGVAVAVTLTPRDLAVWDAGAHAWAGVSGSCAPSEWTMPGIGSESIARTRWPRRARIRASVPDRTDLPEPPLPAPA